MAAVLDARRDYSSELEEAKVEASKIQQESGLQEALNFLLTLEKKCRIYNDFSSLKEISLHMVRICKNANDWDKLNSTLVVISKRRAQSKVAITAIVTEAMLYIDATPDEPTKVALLTTLNEICEGKIYVEAESSKLHLMLSQILEANGDIAGACDMIQDVHVETYGSLDKKEKAEYILHQIRINLKRKDYTRAMIQSRKMNRKVIEEAGFEHVKVAFYQMMIEYHSHDYDSWEISQCYFKIYETPLSTTSISDKLNSLESSIVFLLLSKHDKSQLEMMNKIKKLKDLESIPIFSQILTLFLTKEIISSFSGQEKLENHPSLSVIGGDESQKHYVQLFRTRLVQHNLRVVSGYYKQIKCSRLSELLQLSLEELEDHLSEMSLSGDSYVKIDRPLGIVCFSAPLEASEVLSVWSADIGNLLSLMETTCHLINRENMIYKV